MLGKRYRNHIAYFHVHLPDQRAAYTILARRSENLTYSHGQQACVGLSLCLHLGLNVFLEPSLRCSPRLLFLERPRKYFIE